MANPILDLITGRAKKVDHSKLRAQIKYIQRLLPKCRVREPVKYEVLERDGQAR